MPTPEQIETITKHYLVALLWTMPGDDDYENPGDSIALCDLPQVTMLQATMHVVEFVAVCGELFGQTMKCFEDGYGRHTDADSARSCIRA